MLLFWKKSKTRVAVEKKKAKQVSKTGEQVESGKSDTCKKQSRRLGNERVKRPKN